MKDLIYLLLLAMILAAAVAYRQSKKGYTFLKVFIAALLGFAGLAALVLRFFT